MNKEEEEFSRLDPKTLDPDVAKVIFATEWDDTIEFFRSVCHAAGMTQQEWITLLEADKEMLSRMVPLPKPMTVAKAKPFVELSDMMTLARAARYAYEHMDNLGIDLGQ